MTIRRDKRFSSIYNTEINGNENCEFWRAKHGGSCVGIPDAKKRICKAYQDGSGCILFPSKNELALQKKVHKLNNEISKLKAKNSRNAGRKSIITEEISTKVLELHNQGIAQKLISEQLKISIGTVNKIIKSKQ